MWFPDGCSVVGLPLGTRPKGLGPSRKPKFKGVSEAVGHVLCRLSALAGFIGLGACVGCVSTRLAVSLSWKYLAQPSSVLRSPGWPARAGPRDFSWAGGAVAMAANGLDFIGGWRFCCSEGRPSAGRGDFSSPTLPEKMARESTDEAPTGAGPCAMG